METSDEYEPKDALPDPAALALIAALSLHQTQAIDAALLAAADTGWRKVAYVVATALIANSDHVPGLPDIYYAQRVREMVANGSLSAQGDLSRMRYSEVRIAGPAGGNET